MNPHQALYTDHLRDLHERLANLRAQPQSELRDAWIAQYEQDVLDTLACAQLADEVAEAHWEREIETVEAMIIHPEDELIEVYEALKAALPRVRWSLHHEAGAISGIAGVDVVRVTAASGAWRAEVTGPWWSGLQWGEVALKWLTLELPDGVTLGAALGVALMARTLKVVSSEVAA